MTKGTIRRLISERGFGFIRTEGEEERDLFFHQNDLRGVAYNSLREGQEVEFEVKPTPKGLNAVNVRVAGQKWHNERKPRQ